MPGQEVLGKRLGALELRSRGGRAEAGQAELVEPVHEPRDERRFGADDGQRLQVVAVTPVAGMPTITIAPIVPTSPDALASADGAPVATNT